MKLKINLAQQKEITKLKKLIETHRMKEDKILEGIVYSMHLQNEEETDILWDYIYNDSQWMVDLEK